MLKDMIFARHLWIFVDIEEMLMLLDLGEYFSWEELLEFLDLGVSESREFLFVGEDERTRDLLWVWGQIETQFAAFSCRDLDLYLEALPLFLPKLFIHGF